MSKATLQPAATDDDETLITLKTAAAMLGLSPSSIRLRKAGTENLTIIPQGHKLFVLKSEVLAHRRRIIEQAKLAQEILKDVYSKL